ncbi:NUDIX hydrolase [Virgibacillus ndiopensis]|uniref:NUDIX hydrolase n=1 Tax=Virgibacillus ndiopensis TaxID=2004408 RepID=UPI000C07E9D6|nr:CoA pyrophosphatase [Virgibacillus ndiopensis]
MDTKLIQNKLKSHVPSILGSADFTKYAVLLPLIEKDNEIHILFEVRSHRLRRQPGEICFPGGRMDKQDKTNQDTALRETTEELGISLEKITDVFPLDYLVSPFGMLIFPYVGEIDDPESITPNPSEVEEVFSVPLSFFQNNSPKIHYVNLQMKPEENFPFELIAGGQNYNWRTGKIEEYFYIYEDKVIWGLTARILAHFIEVLR